MKITLEIPADQIDATIRAFRWELFRMEDETAANPDDSGMQQRLDSMDALYWQFCRASTLARIMAR